MFLLPYEGFTIKTRLTAKEVSHRLKGMIEPKRFFRGWGSDHKPYEGKVETDHFTANRIIHYRNSFLPMIKGEIVPEMGGCSIRITMHPHIAVIIFMVFWLGGVGTAFFSAFWSSLDTILQTGFQQIPPLPMLLIPGGMLIFGYVLLLGGFKFEAVKSKTFFRNLFDETTIEEDGMADFFGWN